MSTKTSEKTLQDLFVHALKDIYYAEKAITKALPKMIDKAKHDQLKDALGAHLEETKDHVARLDKVFAELDLKPAAVKCEAIEGILKEGEEVLEQFGDSPAGDAGIIFACQAVEHYEINRYGTMVAWASELKLRPVAQLLKQTLEEEYNADDKLTKLAESSENKEGIVRRAASKKAA
ncbi:MAG TPA: ferritin-like domain-containing protein [Roseiarcus sp.]|nr:ferritin-like domain-containing protein [Roseiarcus sp.]